jgi:hypothetical protein
MCRPVSSLWACVLGLAFTLPVSVCGQTVPPAGDTTGDRPAGAATGGDTAPTHRWPMEVEAGEDLITIYQPQLESFKGDRLAARAAVSIRKQDQKEPVFGAMWIESRVSTDRVARTVDILSVKVTRARFPEAEGAREQVLTEALQKGLAGRAMSISLDQLLAMLAVAEKEKKADEDLRADPPKIEFRPHPTVLVQFDGPPRMIEEGDSKLMRVVNTPFLVVLDPATKKYYLKGAGRWFSAPDALGPFQDAEQVPAAVQSLAEKGGYKDSDEAKTVTNETGVEIVTATEPTELIWTDGPPEMGAVAGTDLLYVANTDADVFLTIETQDVYVLLSGRWYTTKSRQGPWTYVSADKLPEAFKRIPPGSAKGDVLAHVAGTEAAQDAILDTYVPQTAAIDRKKVKPPQVEYDGDPKFEPVEGTTITYAVNTSSSVLMVENQCYCCADAVWFTAPVPTGPWVVCASVPQVIYTLPPSCPIYPVKYVYIYDSDPEFIYCGYTPGYVGCFACGGAVVFGTGYYYHGWVGHWYVPRPYTYGFSAHYNAYTGNWGFTAGVRGPEGWFGVHAGTYGWAAAGVGPHGAVVHGGGWWGNGGYHHADFDRNINVQHNEVNINRQDTRVANANVYNRRDDIRHDAGRPPAGRRADARPLVEGRPHEAAVGQRQPGAFDQRPGGGQSRDGFWTPGLGGFDGRTTGRSSNDVLTDPFGNVHRKTLDGWETRDQGRWVPQSHATPRSPDAPQRPDTPRLNQGFEQQRSALDRDYRARAAGENRAQNYQRSSPPAGSFGGGRMGGGGGRGGRR